MTKLKMQKQTQLHEFGGLFYVTLSSLHHVFSLDQLFEVGLDK